MSGVELKPCGVATSDNILVPLGSTTVGRGPFLGISDKRVSRNHAVLEIEDGKFKVKPIHINPTYFSKNGDAKLKPLKKDDWKELESGNRISLTPSEHIFEVVIDDRPVLSVTQSPRSSVGTASPLKAIKDSPLKSETEDKQDDAPSPTCRKLAFNADNNESTAEEETNGGGQEEGKKGGGSKDDEDKEDKSGDDEDDLQHSNEDDKEYAEPLEKNRELPTWMSNLPSDQKEEQKEKPQKAVKKQKAPAKASKASSRSKKRASEEALDEDEVKPPAKKRGAPARTTKTATPTPYAADDYDDEDEEEPLAPELRKRTSSRGRQTTRVSYADAIEIADDEDDEEFIATKEDDDDDDESDWEEKSTPKRKGKGKGKSPRGAKGKKRRGRRSYSDEESSDEDVYIPKPTKRTAKMLSDSQRSTDSSETTSSKRRRRNQADDEENGDETRKPCPYAPKCNRKSKQHCKEFIHPGDADYKSESEIVSADEADKPECPYGVNCYRTNVEHKKQFKHPLSERPKRQTKRGRKKVTEKVSNDDDGPNTHDDDKKEEETPKLKASDDSDHETQESSEDVSQLVKEVKGNIKNKKMQKQK